jgi:hypothetical protein
MFNICHIPEILAQVEKYSATYNGDIQVYQYRHDRGVKHEEHLNIPSLRIEPPTGIVIFNEVFVTDIQAGLQQHTNEYCGWHQREVFCKK